MRNLHIALVTFGSAGDVHPMLAIGQALQGRGHRVTMLTNPAFAPQVERAGLSLAAIGQAEDYERTVAHPKLWHPIDGLGVMWRYLLRPALAPTCETLLALRAQGLDAVVATPVAMGARVAQERSGVPLLSVYTAATMLRTVHDPLTLASLRMPRWVPQAARRLAWSALDRWKLEPLVRPALDALRKLHGLPRAPESVFGSWVHSPDGGLALFPDWFAAATADWPQSVGTSGFMLYDGDAGEADRLPASLKDFLAAGGPPVVFMPGTAQRNASHFFASAHAACRELGLRGVLLGKSASHPASPTLWTGAYAPFATLLGQARAIVHHGGVGTCAQALRAGTPQLVLPSAYDQFDNAWRIERLGVGTSEPMATATPAVLAKGLRAVLNAPRVASQCAHWRAKVDARAARQHVCEQLEALAR